MKIGVLSDTHRDLATQEKAARLLIDRGARILVHLGDFYTDGDALLDRRVPLLRVPGVHCPEYRSFDVDNRLLRLFDGVGVLMSHTISTNTYDLPTDIRPEEAVKQRRAQVVLYGHTHSANVMLNRGALFVNPGACKHPDARSREATCALLDLSPEAINVRILSVDGDAPIHKHFAVANKQVFPASEA